MFKFKRKNKKGFTLTELLVVVIILSVLTAVSVPSYKRAVERTKAAQGITTLQSIAKAQVSYNARRGTYTSNMYALPIDLMDKDGKAVEGDTFSDRYFDYTVYGNLLSQSLAKREGSWNYELAIDYDTGKLYCTPEDNEICKSLGLDVNTKEIPEGGSGDTGVKVVCNEADSTCYLYDGEKFLGKCGFKETGLYKCQDQTKNGFECDEFGRCGEYKNGVVVEGSVCGKEWVNKEGTACAKQTFKCFKDKGVCITYKDDEEISSCPINRAGIACAVTNSVCYSDGVCREYVDGKEVSSCNVLKDEDCAKKNNFEGVVCNDAGSCSVFKNGENVYTCDKNSNICKLKETGKECPANNSFTGCATNEFICRNDVCAYYDENGNEKYKCEYDNYDCMKKNGVTGTYCDSKGLCRTYEKGEYTWECYKDKGTCKNTRGDGTECPANEKMNGCKEEGGSSSVPSYPCKPNCINGKCECKDDDGNLYYSCNYSDHACLEHVGYSGTYCYADGTCETFIDGKYSYKCGKDGKCSIYDGEGSHKGECTANDTLTGCKEESSSNGLKCDVFTCTDEWGKTCYSDGKGNCISGKGLELACYKEKEECHWYENGKEVGICAINTTGTGCKEEGSSSGVYTCNGWECKDADGNVCYSNGKDGCIEGKGEEIVCMKGQCMTYKDGKKTDWCQANDDGTGCKEDNNLMCAGETCTDPDGNTCFSNGNNGCITGKGWEMGACNDTECYVYQDGKQHKCYRDQWSVGGCNNNTQLCYGVECVYYRYGIPTGETCYNDGGGNCIKGKGEEFICIADQCNLYKDGELVDSCVANTTFTGCRKEGELSGCKRSIIQTSRGFYVEYSEGKPTGVTYMRSEDGKCMGYYNGKPNGVAPSPNYCSGSSSCVLR